jgi:type IV secretory pathway VirB10-like protein
VRNYEQALAAEAARQQQALALEQSAGPTRSTASSAGVRSQAPVDPLTDQRRQLEYQSLFADNVALSRRQTDSLPYAGPSSFVRSPSTQPAPVGSPELQLLQQLLAEGPRPTTGSPGGLPVTPSVPAVEVPEATPAWPTRAQTSAAEPIPEADPIPSGEHRTRLLEGTVIETVLLNRLDGTFAGPVTCLVTTPVYSHDRQSIVIPAGARVLGASSPVQTWGDSRLAVSFHRLLMPNGRTHSLDHFNGLNQIGDTGLKDSVDRHYWRVFGASLAIGALSGLAQIGSRSSFDTSFGDSYRQTAGSSLAASTGRVLDRYLNVLPTITIREGYRIKVNLTNDLELPLYAPVASGGVR